MTSIGMHRIKSMARRFEKTIFSLGAILLYHRVIELPSDPCALCVTPQHFAEHLEVLRKYAEPVSLDTMIAARQKWRIDSRLITVSFDDGYADNLTNALPYLQKYEMPATVFVVTGKTGKDEEFWWDELERLLLVPGVLPPILSLKVGAKDYRWELGDSALYTEQEYEHNRKWKFFDAEDLPSSRHAIYRTLIEGLRTLPHQAQDRLLDEVRDWSGCDRKGRSTHRPMSRAQLAELASTGLVDIGAHTVTHPFLSTLTVQEQSEEIRQSKAQLENWLDRRIDKFAYPFGWSGSFSPATQIALHEIGILAACSTLNDVVWKGSDIVALPRITIFDCDGNEFESNLRAVLNL